MDSPDLKSVRNAAQLISGTPAADDSVNSPAADMARKDSLSLNVEFVKVDVSRSRKGVVSGEAVFNPTMSSSKLSSLLEASPKAANHIRFSGECSGVILFGCSLVHLKSL